MKKTLLRSVALLFVVGGVLSLAACGGGGGSSSATPSGSATATAVGGSPSGEAGEAFAVIQDTLAKVNAGDVDGAYANLSADAQKEVSLPDAKRVIGGLQTGNSPLTLSIDQVGDATVNGDVAEIGLTVRVKFMEVNVPVKDEASLIREGGKWKLADHFLQTALSALGVVSLPQGERQLDSKGCATGDPMQGVYAPARLQIHDPCLTVTGVVANDITKALDGDITFGLILSDADKRLINDVNVQNYSGNLHIEIVPFDQGRVTTPIPGDTITVTGPWVTDLAHGHNEIHPAFVISVQ